MSKYFKRHQPCPSCGSSDALAIYVDGSTFCFSCRKATPSTGVAYNPEVVKVSAKTKSQLEFLATERYSPGEIRGLTEQTRRLYHYCDFEQPDGTAYHYYQAGQGAYKLRYTARKFEKVKDFQWVGSLKEPTLFGINAFEPDPSRSITVLEGEIDAMSYHQLYVGPAVSLVNGAQAADVLVRENIAHYLRGFHHINILFDSDEAGQVNADAAFAALRRIKINVSLCKLTGYKDFNDYLLNKEQDEDLQK